MPVLQTKSRAQYSSMSTPPKKMNRMVAKKKSTMQKAAGMLRKAGKAYVGAFDKHTPIGVAKSAIGLVKDKRAQRKSERGLTNIRAKAAKALGASNRKRSQRNAAEKKDLLNKGQISAIKNSNMSESYKNSLYEQDMRRSGRLGK